jgi:tetratricopeptide (TPR) repeat protein
LGEAERVARELDDPIRLARIIAYQSTTLWISGDHERAAELAETAFTLAKSVDEPELIADAACRLGWPYHFRGQYHRAAELFAMAARHGEEQFDRLHFSLPTLLFDAPTFLALSLVESGHFDKAMRLAVDQVKIAERVKQPYGEMCACYGAGVVALRRGDLVGAIPMLARSLEVASALWFPFIASFLGHAQVLAGSLSPGLPLLEEAVARASSLGVQCNQPLFLAHLGEAHLLAGRRDDAVAVARRALDLAHRQKERGNEAWVLRLLGEIAAQADPSDPKSADAHYCQALAQSNELGMRPLVAHCHLGLGQLYRRTADHARAEEHLTTASAMYREMDMGFWIDRADLVLKEVG